MDQLGRTLEVGDTSIRQHLIKPFILLDTETQKIRVIMLSIAVHPSFGELRCTDAPTPLYSRTAFWLLSLQWLTRTYIGFIIDTVQT